MATIETDKDVFRITATKKVEYMEEYEIPKDELINLLVVENDFVLDDVMNYTDDELLEVASNICSEEGLEEYVVITPNADYDQEIIVEDIYKTTLTYIRDTETNVVRVEDRT